MKTLLVHGADPNLTNSCGWTALHQASHHGHTEVCRLLIDAGVSPMAVNYFGATPLDVAVAGGNVDTISYVINNK